jgi:trehalose 6-phosphate synthase/phosphatase
MPRLIVVSNRLPFTLQATDERIEFRPSSGGLVSALSAYLEARRREDSSFECLWVGWPGAAVPEQREQEVKDAALKEHSAIPVFLSADEVESFYHGFSNETLWPLFHYFSTFVKYDPPSWESYGAVNKKFGDAVLQILEPGDRVWVHDYQLLLLPSMLREARANLEIGFFLHIPFPSYELFRLLPGEWRRRILEGMLGADLLGFQTHDYTQYFLHCVFRTLGYEHHLGQVRMKDRIRRADTFPIGIDFEKFENAARSDAVVEQIASIEAGIAGRRAIFSVDRLDYTKGILNRLRGYEEFLRGHPDWLEKVVFLLTVVPSREEVPQYQRMKQELDEAVGQINGQLGTMSWVPIVYQYRSLDFTTLVALYRLSPVALITPLRDGMNLVAKEYLACKPDGTGVLILSEMAGAARELGEALAVNPNHRGEIAEALFHALTMPPEEQMRRVRPMQERLRAYDARRWASHFLSSLARVKAQQGQLATKHLSSGLEDELARVYREARRPLLLLDYDGTLVPLAALPHLATPDPELLEILSALGRNAKGRVVLTSGRDKTTLSSWFAGIPIDIIAEHGAVFREGDGPWQMLKALASDWKDSLRPIMQMYVDQVVGSLLEEKEYSMAWHYRLSDPELALQRAKELIDDLTQFTANFDVQVIEGRKVVEVRNGGVNKGAAGVYCLAQLEPDFVLAMGDDETDEDLFRALPSTAITIRVGLPFSHAKYNLNDYREVRHLLRRLAQA